MSSTSATPSVLDFLHSMTNDELANMVRFEGEEEAFMALYNGPRCYMETAQDLGRRTLEERNRMVEEQQAVEERNRMVEEQQPVVKVLSNVELQAMLWEVDTCALSTLVAKPDLCYFQAVCATNDVTAVSMIREAAMMVLSRKIQSVTTIPRIATLAVSPMAPVGIQKSPVARYQQRTTNRMREVVVEMARAIEAKMDAGTCIFRYERASRCGLLRKGDFCQREVVVEDDGHARLTCKKHRHRDFGKLQEQAMAIVRGIRVEATMAREAAVSEGVVEDG
eukprot:TRINITY_DN11726_c0_g1_i1.p1 TRINITY_DN11726_c0_g1~~TRINITY_DN11726_c0_g1_i1.p1  ORF type:complete len:279 (+),score=5.16 TRINITY_DN11726_c0_g1_i1:26-862(+)